MMRNVLLTGGTRGLGLATAVRLAELGYHVIATGRSLSPALEEAMGRSAMAGRISYAAMDLDETDQLHDAVRELTKTHGHLYGLVNNAALGFDGVLATMHESQIEQLIRVNLLASILLAKYAARSMLINRSGRIVNVSSVISFSGFNGLSVYAATKAALIGFTKSLARELGKTGITVNTVAPGYMQTDMTKGLEADKLAVIQRRTPLGRLATVEDVAHSIAFLMSDQASMINGANITIDGGSTA